jgi:hypothetical protein
MMLRVVGVPARTASGYAEGMFDEESQSFYITQRDAHTWVEVYFPEYGWVEFEPTAGESPLDRPQNQDDQMAVTQEQEDQEQPSSPLAPTPPAQQNPDDLPPQFTGEELLQNQQGGAPSTLPWWVWALALLFVLPLGAFMIWRVRSSGPTAFSADLPVLLYERLQQWTQRLGLGHSEHQTPYEHTRQIITALPQTQPYVEPLTDEYVRFRFAPHLAVSSPTATGADASGGDPELLQKWQAVEPMFWKAWLRKLRSRVVKQQKNVYHLVDDDSTAAE